MCLDHKACKRYLCPAPKSSFLPLERYEKLKIVDGPDLSPKEGEILIENSAIGVNFADVCIRLGVYESAKQYVGWPITPGFEVSGIVRTVGKSVRKFKEGDKVMGFTLFNGYATQVCIPENQAIPLPEKFDPIEAAGFPAVFFTAYYSLHQLVVFKKGQKVMIHSAGRGSGNGPHTIM